LLHEATCDWVNLLVETGRRNRCPTARWSIKEEEG